MARIRDKVLCNRGYRAYHIGDLDGARADTEESLALAHAAGERHLETTDTMSLGEIARRRGDFAVGVIYLRQALRLGRQVSDPRLYAETLEYLAMTLAEMGWAREAVRLLGAAATLREPIGFPQAPVDADETEAAVASARAALGDGARAAAFAAGQALTLEEAIAEAMGDAG